MPGSTHVIVRRARSDARYPRRFLVRYRRGGRCDKLEHAGSFKTQSEARERRNLVAGWLAAGLDPREELAKLTAAPSTKTLAQWADDWLASRVDAAPKTVKSYRCGIECLRRSEIGSALPASITPADVVGWITENSTLAPASLKLYRMVLAQVLDYALPEGTPNPARHRSVKLPRLDRAEVEPPSAAEFLALLERVPPRSRLPLVVLEQTALRVGELAALTWADVDAAGDRIRVRNGKTRSARRWAQVPGWLMRLIEATCPPDDRTPERRVFQGMSVGRLQETMRRACTSAGIAGYTPHSLRHRRLSLWHGQGIPARVLAERAGHARASMSLDVYSHVMPLDEVPEMAYSTLLVMPR